MKSFRVYRNLHKGNFSVQKYIKDKSGYRVFDRVNSAILHNCKFKVYETGRQRVISEGSKNVHAYIEPESYDVFSETVDTTVLREIYYNPYKFSSFVFKDSKEPVVTADRVLVIDNRVYIM